MTPRKTRRAARRPSIAIGRLWLLYGLLLVLGSALIVRMGYIYLERSDDYLAQGQKRTTKAVAVPAAKGVIADRNGEILAVTTVLYTLGVDLSHLRIKKKDSKFQQANAKRRIQKFKEQMPALAKLLKVSEAVVLERTFLQSAKKVQSTLAKGLLPEQIEKIKQLKLPALVYERTLKRYYPQSEVLANVVGFSDYVDKGRSGVEQSFDGYLRGKNGKMWLRRDRVGNVTSYVAGDDAFEKGKDLMLTIDSRIQSIAFFALKKSMQQYRAKTGAVVVLQVGTGDILAMANLPSYNPNDNRQRVGGGQSNIASQELFEPGSVIKPFATLAALEAGKLNRNTLLHIGKGPIHKIKVADRTYKDSSAIDKQDISVAEMLQKSSNVGAIKVGMKLQPKELHAMYKKLGFGKPTGVPVYGGAFSGVLPEVQEITPVIQASMSMGYALNASVLQMAQAYSVLANQGKLVPLRLQYQESEPQAQQVASAKNTQQVVRWLQGVAHANGTAPLAQVKGFSVAGKTGTTLVSKGQRGYAEKKYIASFMGFAPAEDPQIVVAVLIEHPKGKVYYGGSVAGPVFSEVVTHSLNYLGVRSKTQKPLLTVIRGRDAA